MALSFLVIWHKPNTKLVIQSYLFFSTPPIFPTIFPHNKHTKLPFTPKSPTPQKKIKPQASEMLHYAKHHASENRRAIERSGSVDKCWGHRNKKHKKQPFGEKPNPVGTWYFESTEKVQFFKGQNEKCLRFITFLSTNRLNKAMIGRKRRVKRLFLRY